MFIWHFLVHWGPVQQRGGFQMKKIPQRKKKINPATGKKGICCRTSCKWSEKYLGIIGSSPLRRRKKLDCPRNPLVHFRRWDVSDRSPCYPYSKHNNFPGEPFGHAATFQSLEKFSSKCVLRRCLQCRYDFRRWICLNDFLPGLGWDFFPSFLIFFSLDFYEYWIRRAF